LDLAAAARNGENDAGIGSRSTRSNRESCPECSAAMASGSCRAALAMMPNIISVIAVDEPP
jgi:hypothetical protein